MVYVLRCLCALNLGIAHKLDLLFRKICVPSCAYSLTLGTLNCALNICTQSYVCRVRISSKLILRSECATDLRTQAYSECALRTECAEYAFDVRTQHMHIRKIHLMCAIQLLLYYALNTQERATKLCSRCIAYVYSDSALRTTHCPLRTQYTHYARYTQFTYYSNACTMLTISKYARPILYSTVAFCECAFELRSPHHTLKIRIQAAQSINALCQIYHKCVSNLFYTRP